MFIIPRMQTAPRGAVIRIERTARVRISSPIGFQSSLPYLMQLSRNTGPRAAWTVAFGIQANAMKIFSLLLSAPHDTAKYVPTILQMEMWREVVCYQ